MLEPVVILMTKYSEGSFLRLDRWLHFNNSLLLKPVSVCQGPLRLQYHPHPPSPPRSVSFLQVSPRVNVYLRCVFFSFHRCHGSNTLPLHAPVLCGAYGTFGSQQVSSASRSLSLCLSIPLSLFSIRLSLCLSLALAHSLFSIPLSLSLSLSLSFSLCGSAPVFKGLLTQWRLNLSTYKQKTRQRKASEDQRRKNNHLKEMGRPISSVLEP